MSAHDIDSGRQNLPLGIHPRWWRMTHGPGKLVFAQLMDFLPGTISTRACGGTVATVVLAASRVGINSSAWRSRN